MRPRSYIPESKTTAACARRIFSTLSLAFCALHMDWIRTIAFNKSLRSWLYWSTAASYSCQAARRAGNGLNMFANCCFHFS